MPDNNDKKPLDDNPIYQAILERLQAQDAKIDAMAKKTDEVTDFNRALLSRKGPNGTSVDDIDIAKKKLDAYINEN